MSRRSVFICAGVLCCENASADQLENGSFELPIIAKNFVQIDESLVPGWMTTASDRKIEIWQSGFNGVPAYSGTQFAELNATQPSTLFQSIAGIQAHSIVGFSWAHRGRQGIDTAQATILDLGPDGQKGTADDRVLFQQTAVDGTAAWGFYKGSFASTGRTIELDFAAIDAAGGPSIGNFLDGVTLMAVANLDTIVEGTQRILADESGLIRDSLTYDCRIFDQNHVCLSAGARVSRDTGSGLSSAAGVVMIAYQPFTNARIGAFMETPGPVHWPNGFTYGADLPTVGFFAGYGADGGTGVQLRASASTRRGTLTYVREQNYASGSGGVVSWGVGGEIGYGFGFASGLTLTPFVGVEQVSSIRRLYTESYVSAITEVFTYGQFGSPVTSGRAGAKAQFSFSPCLTASLAAGLEHDFNAASQTLSIATPTMAISYDGTAGRRNRAFGEASVAFHPTTDGEIRLSVLARQSSYADGTQMTAMLTATKGF